MKLSIVVLALIFVLAQSHIQSQSFRSSKGKPDLTEEQKALVREALVPGYKFAEYLNEYYDELVRIRKIVPKTQTETAEVLGWFNRTSTSLACTECTKFFNIAQKFMDKTIIVDLAEKIADKICERKMNPTVCQQAIKSFGDIVWQAAMDRALNSTYVCETIAVCPRTYVDQELLQYVAEVLKDKPATSYPTPTKKNTYTVLQMTDPHIDLQYLAGTNVQCDVPLCCRAESGQPAAGQAGAGYWGTVGNCDIPLRTFDQFLMYTAANFKIDMILWMGDNIAHDIWNQAQDTQEINTYDATQKILQYFPNTTVYPMFGNHEPFPADQFDFSSNSSYWMTSELGDMWKQWLDENAYNVFKNFSYYSMVNPKYNLKVIALDTLTCDSSDFYLLKNPTDPFNQLEWLRNELYDAENRTLSVFILGHISPGDYGCDSEWSARYRALIDRFTNIIRGQFYGHSHDDQFQVVRSYLDNTPVGLVFIAPSLTTYSNLLPSFRIYEMDAETNQPINYYQYRLDLNKWNSNTTGPIEWDLAYDAVDEYGFEDLSFNSYDQLADQILVNQTVANIYLSNVWAGQDIQNVSNNSLIHTYCQCKNSVSEDAFDCLGVARNMGDIMNMIKQALPGQWAYDKC